LPGYRRVGYYESMFRYYQKTFFFLFLIFALVFVSCNTSNSSGGTNIVVDDTGEGNSEDTGTKEPVENESPPENAAVVLDSLYMDSGDSGEALAALEAAGVDSMDTKSRLVYAVLLRDQGRLEESRIELESLVGEDPGNAEAWYNLALLEYALGNDFRGNLAMADSNWEKAEENLKKALQLKPESVESLTGMAWVMAKTDRLDNALVLLDKAVELDPDFVYARVDRSRINVSLRNYNDAERDLDYAIEKEPDVPWHYLDRARIRIRYFQDYDGALDDLNRVEQLDSDNFFALVYLAGVHDDLRHFQLAEDYYKRVVALRSDYIWAYMPLGKFAWMEGEFNTAATWFLKAAAEDPEDFSFLLMAGLSLLRSGNIIEADKLFSETLRMFDQGETAYEVVRFCAERNSDYYAVNALNKESNEALGERLWFYLGAIYEYEKNDIGANAVFQRIAERKGEMEYDLAWAALNGMDN